MQYLPSNSLWTTGIMPVALSVFLDNIHIIYDIRVITLQIANILYIYL